MQRSAHLPAPKSPSLAWPLASTNILCAYMSPCITCFEWIYCPAAAIPLAALTMNEALNRSSNG
jgi:hypothetical protein